MEILKLAREEKRYPGSFSQATDGCLLQADFPCEYGL